MANKSDLKPQARGLLGALVIQYLLGMTANLFVKFPDNAHGDQLWEFAKRQIPLVLHIVLGIGLVIGGIVLIMRSIRSKDHNWIIASSVGFVSVLLAGIAGSVFITTQTDAYSLIMAILFIVAFGAYGWASIARSN